MDVQTRVWKRMGLTDGEMAERRRVLATRGAGHPGNADCYDARTVQPRLASPLQGKRIVFLGSSITEGTLACGQSFVDFMEARDGIVGIKNVVPGSLLVDDAHDGSSYVERLVRIDPAQEVDALVCQLSTIDAAYGNEIGVVGQRPPNTATVAGGIEFIIEYARSTWDCPVFFFTALPFENEQYAQLVSVLKRIADMTGAFVIDFFNASDTAEMRDEDRALYQYDAVHPTRAGYLIWWTPVFERELEQRLG